MALTVTNAQISIQDGAGLVTNLTSGATGFFSPGAIASFALQNTTGVAFWNLKFECVAYPSLHGRIIPWQQGQPNLIQVAMPASAVPLGGPLSGIQLISEISDGVQSIASATYFLQSFGSTGQAMTRYADIATNAALAAYTNVNGVITANANGIMAAVDGVTPTVGMKLLINGFAATAADAGLWQVTNIGTAGTPFVLTRDVSWPNGGVVSQGTMVEVTQGTAWAGSQWKVTATGPVTVGTTNPLLFPRTQRGSGATGGGTTVSITTLFAVAATSATGGSVLTANDQSGAAAVQVGAIVASSVGAGTCTLTGTTAHTICWCLTNW